MKNKSIWKEKVVNKTLSSLNSDISCDVLIIGGGMAGLSTAYFLRDTSLNVVLIEKDKCGEGASSRNTGKLTFMQELVYHKIEGNYSKEVADLYLKSQQDAIYLALNIINENSINCNLTLQDAYVFVNSNKDLKKIDKEFYFYKRNNIDCQMVSNIPTNFNIVKGIKTKESYSFNPYKYMISLKKLIKDKIRIFENTGAISIDKEDGWYLVRTKKNNIIKTKYVVVATHYPFFIIPYFTPFKTTVEKSFIVGGEVSCDNFQAISEGKPTSSFNYYDEDKGYLIYSRRSHGITTNLDTREDKKEIVGEYKKYFDKNPDYYFQNHDLMSYDHIPLIGKVDDNMFVLTGFNK